MEVFKVFSQDRVFRLSSRPLTFQLLVVTLYIFTHFQASAALSSEFAGEAYQGFFCTFSRVQKCAKSAASPGARVAWALELTDAAACEQPSLRGVTAEGFFIGVWMRMDTGFWKLLGTDVFRAGPG